ncbi:cathelicidin antimicrobial peptide-like [Spea bombifrons]|uniref:cathelicidin antimicrobial peptide-like n=1 Tax=Spea bombifrons TaxID=233779 RepID=UPI00234A39BE|nr:cathelicidin antimicrobial peptide-like [Spea bombifrons]
MASCAPLSLLYAAACLLYSAAVPHDFWAPRDPESVQRAVEIYNAEQITGFLYKPLPVKPRQPPADTVPGGVLTFLIKETVCSKSTQQHIGECPFKEDGEVKNCTVSFHGSEDITVTCSTLADTNNVSDNYLTEENVRTKSSKKLARRMKRRSLKLSKTKRTLNGTSSDGSQSSFSCLQCIFDILY